MSKRIGVAEKEADLLIEAAASIPEHAKVNGARVLRSVETFLARFVSYPTEAARIAHTLWIAHAWLMDHWDSTPRIAFLSPEPGSGKSRALEVTEPLVPRAVHAVNVSSAALFRKVSDEAGPPTILYDEADTVFHAKAKADSEDVRAFLNSGHRRGALSSRCVTRGKTIEVVDFPSFCAVALAGLNDLPDTIMTRSVLVRMRRRAPSERVEQWRQRTSGTEAAPIAKGLQEWAQSVVAITTWPEMPAGVEDRDADVWEALLAVADLAGDEWPERARVAAVALVAASKENKGSLGIQLLSDLRTVFDTAGEDRLSTDELIQKLTGIPESPWGDLRGKPLDSRSLAARLGKYEIKPKQQKIFNKNVRGYERTDFEDAWSRYLPSSSIENATSATNATTCAGEQI